LKTAILGATGLVGRIMLSYLSERSWIDADPLLLGTARSLGSSLPFRGRQLPCRDVARTDLTDIDLALFSAGAAASRLYGPLLRDHGAWVVDNSSAFRMDPEVPLVVPEINGGLVPRRDAGARSGGIVANPNCSTIQIALALAPLQAAGGLREVHVTTLQAVSGAGRRAADQLERETEASLSGQSLTAASGDQAGEGVFPQPIAFNVLPAIGSGASDGSYEEEIKVVRELRKILAQPELVTTCTAIRVPVRNGHGAAVRVVLKREVDLVEVRTTMARWRGLTVSADPLDYTTPLQADGHTEVHVGRLRYETGRRDALLFWVVADNLRKGAAWNAVQIADLLAGD